MEFKIGDIIYCINRHYTMDKPSSSLLVYIELHTPYEIRDISYKYLYLKGITYPQLKERFILENDYITMIRKDKIENIKKNIQNDRKIQSRHKRYKRLY